MKKIIAIFISAVFISNNSAAANDNLTAVCETGLMLFTQDLNRTNAALARADNPKMLGKLRLIGLIKLKSIQMDGLMNGL
jgi:hypothetical protein